MDPNDFEKPSEITQYTVYSKSGCPNCNKVKELLKSKNLTFTVIDCDEYLIESKPEFLNSSLLEMNRDCIPDEIKPEITPTTTQIAISISIKDYCLMFQRGLIFLSSPTTMSLFILYTFSSSFLRNSLIKGSFCS